MRKALLLATVCLVLAWTFGCAGGKSLDGFHGSGSGGGGTTTSFHAGNWAFTTNGGINGPLYMGGYLASSGATVSGNLFVLGNIGSGFLLTKASPSMPVTGTISNGTLTLTGALSSSNISITFSNVTSNATTLSGGYSVTGGTDTGDSGTISGVLAGSFTGTWTGTETTSAGTIALAMTEAASPNANGSFTISPTTGSGVAFTAGPGCVVSGTLNPTNSFAAGGILFLDVTTVDNGVSGEMIYVAVANDPTNPTTTTAGNYLYTGGSSCLLQSGTTSGAALALTKQ